VPMKRPLHTAKAQQHQSLTSHFPSWLDYQLVFNDFGIVLRRSGNVATAELNDGLLVFIKLDTGTWRMRRKLSGTWETIAGARDLATLRLSLIKSAR
jgi:hypothetical protein